jgi:hypothetical protein
MHLPLPLSASVVGSPLWGAFVAAITGLAALGFGGVLARMVAGRLAFGERGVLGLFAFLWMAAATHFVAPLGNGFQLWVLVTGGILGLVQAPRLLRDSGRFAVVLAGLTAGYFALAAPWDGFFTYDQGLYYFQIARWNREFPLILGLANLHGRLAFSQGYFLVASVVPFGRLWVPNALLGAFLASAAFERQRRLEAAAKDQRLYWIFLLLACAIMVRASVFAVFFPDTFAMGLMIYWVTLAMERFVETGPERLRSNAHLLILVAAFAVSVKLTALPLLPLTAAVLFGYRRISWRTILSPLAVSCCVLALWTLRSVWLSGCLVYPLPGSCIAGLKWSVPIEQVRWYMYAVKGWARAPGTFRYLEYATSWKWLLPWFKANILVVLAVAGPAGLGLLAALRERMRDRTYTAWPALPVAGLLCVGIAYWFLSAPLVRFGTGYLWPFGLLGIAVALSLWVRNAVWLRRGALAIPAWACLRLLLVVPLALHQVPATPQASVYQIKGADGSYVFVPRADEMCWDHPLPCTPYPHRAWWARIDWAFRDGRGRDPGLDPARGWRYIVQEDASSVNRWERASEPCCSEK